MSAIIEMPLPSLARLPSPVVWEYGAPDTRLVEELTPCELEVLRLTAQGLTNKEIASALGIHWMTVRTHVSNILCKLNARSRTHAVAIAHTAGLICYFETTTLEQAVVLAAKYAELARTLLAKRMEGR